MIGTSVSYKKATTVDEALSLLEDGGQLLAGGHSLVPAMKLRLNQPDAVIDIARIPSLKEIRETDDHLVIGATATHGQIASDQLVQTHCPLFAQGAGMIGDRQVRNMGTIGGSMAHADPAADWPAMLIAADAVVVLQSQNGQRPLPAADFFTGFYETALEDGEMITEIHVPKMHAGERAFYAKFAQPASRYAIVGCAVVLAQDNGAITKARVAFTGVSDCAFSDTQVSDALLGKLANAESISAAADQSAEKIDILSDHYASESYRKHLAKVYAKRALERCI